MNSPRLSRRNFLGEGLGLGAGALAFRSLLAEESGSLRPGGSHFAPTAKSVIFLFMSGGPSQVDTFDPKP
ncbi:MAG: DUF1501 domain-containing protein, partial [Verrucomicrobiae bacterium]|nr:DUF1501 domain-containing protein [Verrucomicrobiae bacterium]